MSKYDPLELFLKATSATVNNITLSFSQIEMIIHDALPQSTLKCRPWWANSPSHSQAKSWMKAGFKVDKNGVNLDQRVVRYRRAN